jgi:hypothetical protein
MPAPSFTGLEQIMKSIVDRNIKTVIKRPMNGRYPVYFKVQRNV